MSGDADTKEAPNTRRHTNDAQHTSSRSNIDSTRTAVRRNRVCQSSAHSNRCVIQVIVESSRQGLRTMQSSPRIPGKTRNKKNPRPIILVLPSERVLLQDAWSRRSICWPRVVGGETVDWTWSRPWSSFACARVPAQTHLIVRLHGTRSTRLPASGPGQLTILSRLVHSYDPSGVTLGYSRHRSSARPPRCERPWSCCVTSQRCHPQGFLKPSALTINTLLGIEHVWTVTCIGLWY